MIDGPARRGLKALGLKMRHAAYARGENSRTLGAKLGVSANTVRHWWAGYSQIPAGRLVQYAALVGVPVSALTADEKFKGDRAYRAGQQDLLVALLTGTESVATVFERLRPDLGPFPAVAALEEDLSLLRRAVQAAGPADPTAQARAVGAALDPPARPRPAPARSVPIRGRSVRRRD